MLRNYSLLSLRVYEHMYARHGKALRMTMLKTLYHLHGADSNRDLRDLQITLVTISLCIYFHIVILSFVLVVDIKFCIFNAYLFLKRIMNKLNVNMLTKYVYNGNKTVL